MFRSATKLVPEQIQFDGFLLRRVHLSDAELIAATVAQNLEWLERWTSWVSVQAGTIAEQRRRLPQSVSAWDQGVSFEFLAIQAGTGTHLGVFGMDRRIRAKVVEIGYWLAADATGHGYATRAVGAMTQAAIRLPGVDRVEIHCDEANIRSGLVPRRLGYRLDRVEPCRIRPPAESGRSMIWVYSVPPGTRQG